MEEGFARLRKINRVWGAKSPATQDEWWRAWKWIGPVFADRDPKTIDLEEIAALYETVRDSVSLREAHRVIKIWRALWQGLTALKYCEADKDPSFGFSNTTPRARSAKWKAHEAIRLAKQAWRMRYHGLAVAIGIAWDTQLSPVDVRKLTRGQRSRDAQGTFFHLGRAKTRREAIGTLCARSERLLDAYIARLGIELLDDAPIVRNRSGAPYSKDTLGDDFRDVRAALYGPAERRTIADMRRSGALELVAGAATPAQMSAKMANDISTSNELQKAYTPVDLAAVREADAARKIGRRKIRSTQ
jgi:hypothetical protein